MICCVDFASCIIQHFASSFLFLGWILLFTHELFVFIIFSFLAELIQGRVYVFCLSLLFSFFFSLDFSEITDR